jgi:hypothetical protein
MNAANRVPIDLLLKDFIPRPKLFVNETQIDKPKFPVIDGDFDVTVFVQNSVNREFSFFSEKISVPPPDRQALFGPLVSHRVDREARAGRSAFSADLRLQPDPKPSAAGAAASPLHRPGRDRPMAQKQVSNLPAAGAPVRSVSARPSARSPAGVHRALDQSPGQYRLAVRSQCAANRELERRSRIQHFPAAAFAASASGAGASQ